jgi:hypothetical protein
LFTSRAVGQTVSGLALVGEKRVPAIGTRTGPKEGIMAIFILVILIACGIDVFDADA